MYYDVATFPEVKNATDDIFAEWMNEYMNEYMNV